MLGEKYLTTQIALLKWLWFYLDQDTTQHKKANNSVAPGYCMGINKWKLRPCSSLWIASCCGLFPCSLEVLSYVTYTKYIHWSANLSYHHGHHHVQCLERSLAVSVRLLGASCPSLPISIPSQDKCIHNSLFTNNGPCCDLKMLGSLQKYE